MSKKKELPKGEFLYHTQCECGSSDGLAVYSSGTGYCYKCGKYYNNLGGDMPNGTDRHLSSGFTDATWEKADTTQFSTVVRGISPQIYNQYSYFKAPDGSHVINHYDLQGNIVAQKYRFKDKTFTWKGNNKQSVPFGMGQWRSGGKRITITEGELDCLSIAEALGGKYPVISINNGAGSAAKELQEHIEFLNSYQEIVLWFDNDSAGQAAIKKVATLFPVGKVYIVNSGTHKDANEVLQQKGKAGVLQYYYETKKYAPDGIVIGSSLDYDSLISFSSTPSFTTPYPELDKVTKGIRKRELVMFTAGSGIGKSTIVREIAYHLLTEHKCKIGYVALEESVQRTALGLMSIHMEQPVYMQEIMEEADKTKVHAAYEAVVNNDNLLLYDSFGSIESDNLLSKLRYLAVGMECDFIFLDHISIVISGTEDLGDSERRAIDILMTKLRSLAEETGVGIVAVTHLKRPQGSNKGYEDGLQVSLSSLRGSGSIAQLSDTVIALERDQQSLLPDVATVRVLKNRYAGVTGVAGKVKYYTGQGRLLPFEETEEFSNESGEDEF